MAEQLNIHGGAETIRATDPPTPVTHEERPLFDFPQTMRGQLPIDAGPIRDLDAWCETVVPDA
jgi:hypothetical protein